MNMGGQARGRAWALPRAVATTTRVPTMYLRRLTRVLRKAGNAWIDDHAQSMGAALSYYTVFSIAPLLLIAISVAGLVFGQDAARGAVVQQLQGLIGQSGAQAIQDLLKNVSKPAEGIVATITGVVVLVIGATSVFAELQDDLNRIWQVPTKDKVSSWWAWLRTRILSMGMIFAIGFMLLVSLAASAAFDAFAPRPTSALAGGGPPGP